MSMIDIKATRDAIKRKAHLLEMIKDDPRTIKFTMNMSANLHKDFKLLATTKGVSMTDIINDILLNYIRNELKDR